MDSSDDAQWLTYDEIAAARGTEKVGAIRWVQRHKWRKQPGNDGLVRVLVPHDVLARSALRRTVTPTVTPTVNPPEDGVAAAFEAALAAMREAHAGELAAIRAAHDSELAKLQEQLRTAAKGLVALQEHSHTAETRHAEELVMLGEQLRTIEAHQAEERAALQEQLRTAGARHAEELAVLGEQLHTAGSQAAAAQDATEKLRHAQEEVAGERLRADALGATVDTLMAGRASTAEAHARELEELREQHQAAFDAVLRAEEARKARGLLARLGDALRGR